MSSVDYRSPDLRRHGEEPFLVECRAYPGESPRAANIINAFRSLAPHEAVHLARRKGNEAVPEISGTMCACEFTAVTCNVSGNSTLCDSGAVTSDDGVGNEWHQGNPR